MNGTTSTSSTTIPLAPLNVADLRSLSRALASERNAVAVTKELVAKKLAALGFGYTHIHRLPLEEKSDTQVWIDIDYVFNQYPHLVTADSKLGFELREARSHICDDECSDGCDGVSWVCVREARPEEVIQAIATHLLRKTKELREKLECLQPLEEALPTEEEIAGSRRVLEDWLRKDGKKQILPLLKLFGLK